MKIVITEEQLQKLSEYMISNKLFEGEFRLDTTNTTQIDHIFNIFKQSYEKSTGGSWDKSKFLSRASDWLFFGDMDGFIAVRPQKSGLYKLVGVAGSPKSILSALSEIESKNIPVWGMVTQNIQTMLQKKGFITPTPEQLQLLYKSIPSSVFGGAETQQNPDGSLTLKYNDVGDATKFFVGNEMYFNAMKTMFGDKFNLDEARSNPEKNPRVTFGMFMDNLVNKYTYENIFVSFRNDLHVTDVNVNNKYSTPTGVYSYPLISYFRNKYDLSRMDEGMFREAFPYQSKLPYMYFIVLKSHNGILDENTTFEQVVPYVKKIMDLYGDITPVYKTCELYLNKDFKSTYNSSPYHEAHNFWLFLYEVAAYITKNKKQHAINIICTKIGVNGFVDYKGNGYIHPSEPKQAVFFRIKPIADVLIYKTQITNSNDKFESYLKQLKPGVKNQVLVNKLLDFNLIFNYNQVNRIVNASTDQLDTALRLIIKEANKMDLSNSYMDSVFFAVTEPGGKDKLALALLDSKLIYHHSIVTMLGHVSDENLFAEKLLEKSESFNNYKIVNEILFYLKDPIKGAKDILAKLDLEFASVEIIQILIEHGGDVLAYLITNKVFGKENYHDFINTILTRVKDNLKYCVFLIKKENKNISRLTLDTIFSWVDLPTDRAKLMKIVLQLLDYQPRPAILKFILSNSPDLYNVLNAIYTKQNGFTDEQYVMLFTSQYLSGKNYFFVLDKWLEKLKTKEGLTADEIFFSGTIGNKIRGLSDEEGYENVRTKLMDTYVELVNKVISKVDDPVLVYQKLFKLNFISADKLLIKLITQISPENGEMLANDIQDKKGADMFNPIYAFSNKLTDELNNAKTNKTYDILKRMDNVIEAFYNVTNL